MGPCAKLSLVCQSECVTVESGRSDQLDCQCSSLAPEGCNSTAGCSESWMVLSIAGDKPKPRFNVKLC